jgi:hypothetical protein
MSDLWWTFGAIIACLLAVRFRDRILGALKRFDDGNAARIAQQQRDRNDPKAHVRHTLEVADEQVEPVEEIIVADRRTGEPVTHYLFEAQVFATREEAEQMRAARVGVVARRFYEELPTALAAPSSAARPPRSPLSARERASQRWRRTVH